MNESSKKNRRTLLILCGCALSTSACGGDGSMPDYFPPPNDNVIIQKCDPAQDICLNKTEVLHCVDGIRKREYCPAGELCYDGNCGAAMCKPYEIDHCLPDGKYYGCNGVGTGMGEFECDYGKTCIEGKCQARMCLEGSGRCLDEETILLCNDAGTEYSNKQKCSDIKEKTICQEGKCIPICEKTAKDASYIGCEYWAVDLDNAIDAGVYDAAGQPFAVVLGNTHESLTADIEIYIKEKGKVVKSLEFEVPPGEVRAANLPDKCYNKPICDRAYSVNNTTITDTAYYIKSDLPITAAQFNPLDNVEVYSNDASLLFPTTALGMRYMVMARQQHYDTFHAFMTVVATQPGKTKVVVESSCQIMAGTDKNGKKIYPMQKGDLQTFILDQYDVLNLETAKFGEDPTGSMITADKLIAVFAGNEATSLPETDPVTCCADHIEHQLYPLGAWGKKYNAVKLRPRNKERDLWRIMARTDGTVIKTTPNVFKKESLTLNAGQWHDVLTTKSFMIEASSPVLVGQFMTGEHDPICEETGTRGPDSANIGDPAYIIGVPVEQYRTDYQFLAPSKYKRDFITIVAPKGTSVFLDGKPIPQNKFFEFGDGSFTASYQEIADGSHRISATKKIGLFSYGYDSYVSYGYPAGLDLHNLFEDEP